MKNILTNYLFVLFSSIIFSSCHSFGPSQGLNSREKKNMHNLYDDSTMNNRVLPVLMPYNRIINPAGKVVSFGEPANENHSLDAKIIPETPFLIIEDRFGIALLDTIRKQIIARWTYSDEAKYRGLMSTFSGIKLIKTGREVRFFWSAANLEKKASFVMQAMWDGGKLTLQKAFSFDPVGSSPLALPNDLFIENEDGKTYLYVVLNGNNQLKKLDLNTGEEIWSAYTGVAPYGITLVNHKIYVSNWGGDQPYENTKKETAGVPYGNTFIDPATGATSTGSMTVINPENGYTVKKIPVGLHPNAVLASRDGKFIYVANGNSDMVSVLSTDEQKVVDSISVSLNPGNASYIGDTPNALALNDAGTVLYVANGMDNALAVVSLGSKSSSAPVQTENKILGFIPTEAYPGGIVFDHNQLFVTNLEGEGARISSAEIKKSGGQIDDENPAAAAVSYNSHHQKATVSIIPVPGQSQLDQYTAKVKELNLSYRQTLSRLLPRKNVKPKPMPERIGEPSVFTHVIYIIKENRTYDQVMGDVTEGNGMPSLCIFGESVTPNQHKIAKDFLLLDNYYASGKCSAEGHQWTDAAIVTDYVEKNVRAWFRSYPHVQEDALVYDKNGFIWNNAADHGKTVRIYGEASTPHYNSKLSWTELYNIYQSGKPLEFTNTSTISRVRPMLSQNYPASDEIRIPDQFRASAFVKELHEYEKAPGDTYPNLVVMALSDDHTAGTRPGIPTPRAMVADNDLALGRIIEALSKSKFWKNTVVFVTEDDSQAGWDHVSAYRTTGFVISPYSHLQKVVKKNYNQTSIVRSIEQILGIPPMNIIDATALPMFECFNTKISGYQYSLVKNHIPLNEMNPRMASLKGPALHFAQASSKPEYDHPDGGNDDVMNRILWFSAKGSKPYPAKLAGKDGDDKD